MDTIRPDRRGWGNNKMPPKHEKQCIGCEFDQGQPYASEGCLGCNRRFNQRNTKLPDLYKAGEKTMKTEKEIIGLLSMGVKSMEKELDLKIRNGQYTQGIKAVCRWLIK